MAIQLFVIGRRSTMLFSYGSGRQRINSKKNAGDSMAILIAVAM